MSRTMETMDEEGGCDTMLRHAIRISRKAMMCYDHFINAKDDAS